MKAEVKKWGNSPVIRIPKVIMQQEIMVLR